MFGRVSILKLQRRDQLLLLFFFVLMGGLVVWGVSSYLHKPTKTVETHAGQISESTQRFFEMVEKKLNRLDRFEKLVMNKLKVFENAKALLERMESSLVKFQKITDRMLDWVPWICRTIALSAIMCAIAAIVCTIVYIKK